MNTESLRQKLLAQRAAIREETERREKAHEDAKDATKVLTLLGYNFEDIIDLATPKVSENYLLDIFRSIGYTGKRKRLAQKNFPFGAPRWLEIKGNMTISLDSDSEEDDTAFVTRLSPFKAPEKTTANTSLAYSVPSATISKPSNVPQTTMQDIAGPFEENTKSTLQIISVSPSPTKTTSDNLVEENESEPSTEQDRKDIIRARDKSQEVGGVNAEGVISDAAQPLSIDNSHAMSLESKTFRGEDSSLSDSETKTHLMTMDAEDCPNTADDGPEIIDLTRDQFNNNLHQSTPEQMDIDSTGAVMITEHTNDVPGETRTAEADGNEIEKSERNMEEVHEMTIDDHQSGVTQSVVDVVRTNKTGDVNNEIVSHDEEMSDVSPLTDNNTEINSQDSIREQTERVKAQIQEIRARKVRLAEQRRNVRLREVATKKLKLLQLRQSLDMGKATAEVARLENKLMAAKAHMIHTAQKIKELDRESEVLDKEEAKIREEGKADVDDDSGQDSGRISKTDETTEIEENSKEIAESKPIYTPLTVESSPLRMFSSFRMCPSLNSRYWFAPTFNSRFVKDLEGRVMCETELKRGVCRNKNCNDVHFYEFEVPGAVVCQYMASREIDDPGFRAGLVDAVETHLKDEETPVGNLAATIIGYRRKRHATQFLDWGASNKPF